MEKADFQLKIGFINYGSCNNEKVK
jgi:hypothetical protein